ncbi:MAG: peptide deformylase [Deltaproteobacteria bacterium]|nr:peptide deformylase [Deltaproteobacteria bacterium]
MAILPITIYPAPILQQCAEPIGTVTAAIQQLLDDMAETMYAAPGVGLAGPQVNQPWRVIVVDVGEPVTLTPDDPDHPIERSPRLYQLINPSITHRSGTIQWEEGCLSLPDFRIEMQRAAQIVVEALDRNGSPIMIDAQGLLAVALQHEIDHLDGKLLIDHVSRLKRRMYAEKLEKQRRED